MKVIIASGQYPPTVSGIASLAHALASGLETLGDSVEVITEGSGCSRIGKVARLDSSGKRKIDVGGDILQVIGPTPMFSEQVVNYGKKRGLTVVYRLDSLPGLQTYFDNPLSRLVDRMYESLVLDPRLNRTDHAVLATRDLANRYPSYVGPYDVIPSGVLPCVCPPGEGRPPRPMGGVNEGPIGLLFVGQLRPYKGVKYLLHAYHSIRAILGREATLTIVGDGPERDLLVRLCASLGLAESVKFTGWVSEAELHRIYRTHDLLVLPSISAESFGLVLLEANRHGLPVVATDLPGVRELATTLHGIVVEPRSSDALAEGVLRTLSLGKSRQGSGIDISKYLWPNIVLQYSALYRRLVAQGRS